MPGVYKTYLKEKLCFCIAKVKVQIFILFRILMCSTDESFWKNQLGNEMWFSYGSNRSAGVAILKDKFRGQVLHSEKHVSGRWIILVVDINHNQFILIHVYATNKKFW